MNKKILALLPLAALILTGCNSPKNDHNKEEEHQEEHEETKTIVSLGEVSAPKTIVQGTSIDKSLVSVVVNYSDNTHESVTPDDVSLNTSSLGQTTGLVSYKGYSASFSIEVIKQGEDDKNKELETWNSLVSSIKTNHNYTIHVHSQFDVEEDESEILDCNYFSIDNKAWYTDYSGFAYQGIISQKDQGFINFYLPSTSIIYNGFESTNTKIGISDFYDLIGENLFFNSYEQDKTNQTKFTSTGIDNITTMSNFTQYTEYIKSKQFSFDSKGISAVLDVAKKEISLTLKWWIWFYDQGEHNEPGTITITVKNIGTTTNSVVESYIKNPTNTFTAPTTWPAESASVFHERFDGLTPVFPSGVSYSFKFEEELYEGYYYASVTDYASGDLRTSYGNQLVGNGYTKVNENKYIYEVKNQADKTKKTYSCNMKYIEATTQFPKGTMILRFRCDQSKASFDSIAEFNEYLSVKGYAGLFPAFPEESTCTGITNLDDTSSTSSGYTVSFNGTSWFHIRIPSYSNAKAWVDQYSQMLINAKYNDVQETALWKSFGYEDSVSGTIVCIATATESNYPGYIDMRLKVSDTDAAKIRHANATLESITLSGQTTSYHVGDQFSFDGTCTAHYSDGTTSVVTPTSVSSPSMTSIGKKDVTVSYTFKDVTKTASYQINVEAKVYPTINVSGLDEHVVSYNVLDEHGQPCSTWNYDISNCFIVQMTLEEGYTITGYSLKNDPNVDVIFDGALPMIEAYVYPNVKTLASYNINFTISNAIPEPVTYTLAKQSVSGGQIVMVSPFTTGSNWKVEPGTEITFRLSPFSGYEPESVSIVDHPEITFTTKEVSGHTQYSFIMPEHDCTITASFKESAPTPTLHHVYVDSSMEGGYITLSGRSSGVELEKGTQVRFSVTAREGYEIGEVFIKDHSEIEIYKVADLSGEKYAFDMPDFDCTVSATFTKTVETYSVSKEIVGSGTVNFTSQSSDLSAGDVVTFTVKPAENFALDSIEIVGHPEIKPEFVNSNPFTHASQYHFKMISENITLKVTFISTSTDPVLTGITLSGTQPTSFSTGDSFSYEGLVVTANYSDSSTQDVTSLATVSSPDMSTSGDKSVLVTYEGQTASYTISVTGGEVSSVTYFKVCGSNFKFDVSLTINSDGTGVYSFNKQGTSKIYTYYLSLNKTSSTTYIATLDSSKKSDDVASSGNYNMFRDGVTQNELTIRDNTISFTGYYSTGSAPGVEISLDLQK